MQDSTWQCRSPWCHHLGYGHYGSAIAMTSWGRHLLNCSMNWGMLAHAFWPQAHRSSVTRCVQVAVVIGAHRSSVCPSCTHQEIAEPMYAPLWSAASLCGHRSREAMICITDMRTPQIVDRCNLPSVSVLPQIAACPSRDHYVFTRFVLVSCTAARVPCAETLLHLQNLFVGCDGGQLLGI